jgi:adenylate cyclase
MQGDQLERLSDWLIDGAPGATSPLEVLGRFCDELRQAGIPIDRAVALVRTLHPSVMGRRFIYEPGQAVVVNEAPWALASSERFKASPAMYIATGEELRARLAEGVPTGYAALEELKAAGFTDYLGLPMRFMSGSTHVISFASKHAGGFGDDQLEALRWATRRMTRVAETLALMRTSASLLSAYVGRDAGARILNGQVQLGDTETIRCVIWFSDLRGFTSLSGTREPREIITVLNEFFNCQVPALDRHGGEVLKFIGDGLLAIFPLVRPLAEVGPAAVSAAREASTALEALNQTRQARGEEALDFGVALHVGEVAYGNIGGAGRLDFTAIGPAVNLASRIEGLTAKTGHRVLLSDEFVQGAHAHARLVGTFEVKGVTAPQRVYEP